VAFSPDGEYVVSGSSDNTVRVWNASTGEEIARMTHDANVGSIAFSPDGKYVVSGGCDERDVNTNDVNTNCIKGSARVWEASTGQEVARMTHVGGVYSVAFSPDGKYVVSGGCDERDVNTNCIKGSARVWIWRPDDLITIACSRLTRNLTRDEWDQYIGDVLPYQAVCPNLPIEPAPTPTP
jgi:WD40 repeat protein